MTFGFFASCACAQPDGTSALARSSPAASAPSARPDRTETFMPSPPVRRTRTVRRGSGPATGVVGSALSRRAAPPPAPGAGGPRAPPSRRVVRGEHPGRLGEELAHELPVPLDLRGDRRPGLLEPVQHLARVAVVVADRPERRVAPVPPPDAVPAPG